MVGQFQGMHPTPWGVTFCVTSGVFISGVKYVAPTLMAVGAIASAIAIAATVDIYHRGYYY